MGPLRLMRRITAGAGGWAGDNSTPWVGDDGSNAPAVASAPAVETGEGPILDNIPQAFGTFPVRGVVGLVRVTGADATRHFNLRIVHGWQKRQSDGTDLTDWRELSGASPLEVVDGQEFTTIPQPMVAKRLAFHLVPLAGNLAAGSVVEIWAAVF